MVLYIVHISRTWMIGVGIYGLSRGNNLGGIMRGLNSLQFLPLVQWVAERPDGVDTWLGSLRGHSLNLLCKT